VSAVFTIAYAREQEAGVSKAGALDRVKNILAASTREDWEAHGTRLWVRKGASRLRIVDLTDDEGRVELKEEWAKSAAGVGSVALRVELSICQGSLVGEGPRGLRGLRQGVHTLAWRRGGWPAGGRSLAVRPLQGDLSGGVSGRLPLLRAGIVVI
jgi:hypothetical protein